MLSIVETFLFCYAVGYSRELHVSIVVEYPQGCMFRSHDFGAMSTWENHNHRDAMHRVPLRSVDLAGFILVSKRSYVTRQEGGSDAHSKMLCSEHRLFPDELPSSTSRADRLNVHTKKKVGIFSSDRFRVVISARYFPAKPHAMPS